VVSATPFTGGQSNPTFLLATSSGQRFVLRKKPAGTLLAKAHQVDREFRILSALSKTAVPVPRVYALCSDDAVIGQMFYICEYLEGRVLRDLSSVPPAERAPMMTELARVLALLHRVDFAAVGLRDFGQEGNYYRRQLRVWSDQWKKSQVEPVPRLDELIQRLGDEMQEQRKTTIVHGDYRLENVMFHPTQPRIIGVLDWEISTIGDPRADVAHCSLQYHWDGVDGSMGEKTGTPSEADFVASYCHFSGQSSHGIDKWGWHIAFAFFRMAAIGAGVYKRALQGNASDGKNALKYGPIVQLAAEAGLDALTRLGETTVGKVAPVRGRNYLPTDPKTAWYNLPSNRSAYTDEELREGSSLLQMTARAVDLLVAVNTFMNEHIFPAEGEYIRHHHEASDPWEANPVIERLKVLARKQGLWNLFLTSESGLTNLEYARMAEVMGQVVWASEVFNCSAPDTGNMEILHLFGTPDQKKMWLEPLLDGHIRSAFGMTEPDVASSDARNITLSIAREGSDFVLNGRKWYISGAGDHRCKVSGEKRENSRLFFFLTFCCK
jgi:aminoglycoside phosphotransferase (APT) family kinase protein